MTRTVSAAIRPLLLLVAIPLGACQSLYDWVGGDFEGPPAAMQGNLSPTARHLIAAACEGISSERFSDIHMHAVGGSVHPTWLSWWHPDRRGRTMIFLRAAGVTDPNAVHAQYADRLEDLVRYFPLRGQFFLYAMDRFHRPDGSPDLDRTPYHVPNESVVELARRLPGQITPVVSVHPYRRDALAELDRWASAGCRYVKWIPSAMGIDPSDPRIDTFYATMRKHGMTLLSHTGSEQAMETWGLGRLDNPLLLRRPLRAGVRVVALHCGTGARYEDLDNPKRPRVEGFDLFLSMLDNPAHQGLLYGDLSALTFVTRSTDHLKTLLERPELHGRLLHGSDYPVCAISMVVRMSRFVRAGMITRKEADALDQIRSYHPLLFDFVLKRTMRHPETRQKLAAEMFMLPAGWP